MKKVLKELLNKKKNFVFVGEAGCGKSEIAINFAINLAKISDKPVHFFDVDQTKPLFRSRDVKEKLAAENVNFHYEEQFFDAPTIVGGVREHLANEDVIVVIDVGGDHLGARLIGGFADLLNREYTQNFFVINSYRPWSKDLVTIDGTMARVLGMAHIEPVNISIMSNPNVGVTTTAEEALDGGRKTKDLIDEYFSVDYMCAREEICPDIQDKVDIPLLPIKLYLTYEWNL